jgi:hypothetical protein
VEPHHWRKLGIGILVIVLVLGGLSVVPLLFWFRWGTSGLWSGLGLISLLVFGSLTFLYVKNLRIMKAHREKYHVPAARGKMHQ